MFTKLFNLLKSKNDSRVTKETRLPEHENKWVRAGEFEVQNELFQETFKFSYESLTNGQRVLHNLFILIGDVDNGGYVQYLQNNKDERFSDLLKAFEAIKFQKGYENFKKVTEVYYRNKAFLSAEDLDASLRDKDEKLLEKLEQQFYEQQKSRDRLVTDYIRQNFLDFFQPQRRSKIPELFEKAKSETMMYKGKKLYLADYIDANKGDILTVKVVSFTTNRTQIFYVSVEEPKNKKLLEVNGKRFKGLPFHEAVVPKDGVKITVIEDSVRLKVTNRAAPIFFWPMMVEQKENKRIYYCNGEDPDEKFDDLVLEIEVQKVRTK